MINGMNYDPLVIPVQESVDEVVGRDDLRDVLSTGDDDTTCLEDKDGNCVRPTLVFDVDTTVTVGGIVSVLDVTELTVDGVVTMFAE